MPTITIRVSDEMIGEIRRIGPVTETVVAALTAYIGRRTGGMHRVTERPDRSGWVPTSGDSVLIDYPVLTSWHGTVVRVMRNDGETVVCRRARPGGAWSHAAEIPIEAVYPSNAPLTVDPAKSHTDKNAGKRCNVTGGEMYRVPATVINTRGNGAQGRWKVRTASGKECVVPKEWVTVLR